MDTITTNTTSRSTGASTASRSSPGNALDPNTAQTPGMNRATAINHARAGAEKIWAGTVTIHANAKTGAHHHGDLESIIYVVKGKARMRWGENLEFVAEAGPGDFIFVPPFVPHQEINASRDETLECVLVRSDRSPLSSISTSNRWKSRKKCSGKTRSIADLHNFNALGISDAQKSTMSIEY